MYLIFLRARGQALDLGSKLNKHVSYGGNPGVKVFILVILGTEIILIPPTLLHTSYSAVGSTMRHTHINVYIQ